MDHSNAMQIHAAEKYVLGELPKPLRDEYEEHYFSCQECAEELKVTAAFLQGSRAILLNEQRAADQMLAAPARPARGAWLGWLRPAFAVPVLAGLLLMISYQNLVTIPRLKSESATAVVGQDADLVSLIGVNSRGGDANALQVHQNRPAILEVDIPATSEYSGYLCRLQDEAGRLVYEDRISSSDAKKSVHLIISQGKLQNQKYALVIFGEGSARPQAPSQTEIDRIAFTVEILR
jgi:hypothetical protein